MQLVDTIKAFADEGYVYGAGPNRRTGFISLALPGTLPILNKVLLEKAYKMAKIANCKMNPIIRFDRKAYFYPDLPKAYQITQKDNPLGIEGVIPFPDSDGAIKNAFIERIHMEEDSGKTLLSEDTIKLDYNRAGVALIEIVTVPCFTNLEDVISFLKYLQLLLQYYGISDARMEKGEMRVDANLSISIGSNAWSLPSEIKNMNSFSYLRKAMIQLMNKLNATGEEAEHERYTYSFDESSGGLRKLRGKEAPATYRYMPEPDLGHIRLEDVGANILNPPLRKIPVAIYTKMLEHSVSIEIAREIVYNLDLLNVWIETYKQVNCQVELSLLLVGPLRAIQKKNPLHFRKSINKEDFAKNLVQLMNMIYDKKLNKNTARQKILPLLFKREGNDIWKIVEERAWFLNNNDDSLFHSIDSLLNDYPKQVEAYQNGKTGIAGFFMGKLMKKHGSRMDPKEIMEYLKASLEKYRPGDTKKSE